MHTTKEPANVKIMGISFTIPLMVIKGGMVALGVPPYFCWENNLSMHVTANPGVK